MRILHPTDFSTCADHAQEEAVRLARATGGEILLAHVTVEETLYPGGMIAVEDLRPVYAAQRKWAENALEARAAALREAGIPSRWLVREGEAYAEIVKMADEEKADLIVLGTHGRGRLERLFIGSVADRVVRTANCPVLTVRERSGQ